MAHFETCNFSQILCMLTLSVAKTFLFPQAPSSAPLSWSTDFSDPTHQPLCCMTHRCNIHLFVKVWTCKVGLTLDHGRQEIWGKAQRLVVERETAQSRYCCDICWWLETKISPIRSSGKKIKEQETPPVSIAVFLQNYSIIIIMEINPLLITGSKAPV